jgi:hypothetical protein
MAGLPPPEGLTEEDYDSIHAAVVETVRGRWFLAEYARRSRVDEVREMLTAIGRLEEVVTNGRALPAPSDASPHLRMLTQRASEIASTLAGITDDLRESGADPYLCDDLETQIRAIAGLPKGISPQTTLPASQTAVAPEAKPALEAPRPQFREAAEEIQVEKSKDLPMQGQLPQITPEPVLPAPTLPRAMPLQIQGEDMRLGALAALDRLSLAEKLALFA